MASLRRAPCGELAAGDAQTSLRYNWHDRAVRCWVPGFGPCLSRGPRPTVRLSDVVTSRMLPRQAVTAWARRRGRMPVKTNFCGNLGAAKPSRPRGGA